MGPSTGTGRSQAVAGGLYRQGKDTFITSDYYSSAITNGRNKSRFSSYSSSSSSSSSHSDAEGDDFCFDDLEEPASTLSESRSSSNSASPVFKSRDFKSRRTSSAAISSSYPACTCNAPVASSSFSSNSSFSPLTVEDRNFGSTQDRQEYDAFVRVQTRNVAKRRTSSSTTTSHVPSSSSLAISSSSAAQPQSRGRARQRRLQAFEEQLESNYDSSFKTLPEANSVPEYAFEQYLPSGFTSSFEPRLLIAKLEALLLSSPQLSPSQTSSSSSASNKSDASTLFDYTDSDDDDTDYDTDIEELDLNELVKVSQHVELESDLKSVRPVAIERVETKLGADTEDKLERALAFARWSRRGRAGVWESPEGVSDTVRELVATLD